MSSQSSDLACILEEQNLNNFFNATIFEDADFDEMLPLISCFQNPCSNALKYDAAEKLVKQYMTKISISDVEDKLFQHLLPAIEKLLIDVLKENGALMMSLPENKLNQLETPKECVKFCINLLDLVNNIACYISTNKTLQLPQIKSFPVNVAAIVLLTFTYCKDMKEIYASVGNTKDIILLFKKAQCLHLKLIEIFKSNVSTNISSDFETIILHKMLHILGEIGAILLDINLKTSADNWIGYINISQKFFHSLDGKFNVHPQIKFLTNVILDGLNKISLMEFNDAKSKDHVIKTFSLLVKVLNRLLDIFRLQVANEDILSFFVGIFHYSNPMLKNKLNLCLDVNKDLLFVCSCLSDTNFFKILDKIPLDANISPANEYGFFILLVKVFEAVSEANPQEKTPFSIYRYLLLLFLCIEKHSLELFYKMNVRVFSSDNLFNEITFYLAKTIILHAGDQYDRIEELLFEKLFSENIWSGLLALEIWSLVLKLNKSNFQFQTLCNIIQKVRPILKANVALLPKIAVMKVFMKRIFEMLNEDCRLNMIENYPILDNLDIWRCFGLKKVPNKSMYTINNLVFKCIHIMNSFLSANIDKESFIIMCQMWEILSTIDIINIHTNKLYMPLIQLWEIHNFHEDALNYSFCNYYVSCLFTVTNRFITSMSNNQILTVLNQAKVAVTSSANDAIKESAVQLLNTLSNKQFGPKNLQSITIVLGEILNTLLQTSNMIIKQRALELLHKFMLDSPHEDIVQKAAYSSDMQVMLSNFFEKSPNISDEEVGEYLLKHLSSRFMHTCTCKSSDNYAPKCKRIKLDDGANVSIILERIRSDVENLKLIAAKTRLDDESKSQLDSILCNMQTLY